MKLHHSIKLDLVGQPRDRLGREITTPAQDIGLDLSAAAT